MMMTTIIMISNIQATLLCLLHIQIHLIILFILFWMVLQKNQLIFHYSISGRKIEQFSIPRLDDQQHKIGWLPKMNIPSGTYFIQASTNYMKQTQKILFIK